MTGVEDCKILFLLVDVRHAKILTHSVRKQLRVVGLLRTLDIPSMKKAVAIIR